MALRTYYTVIRDGTMICDYFRLLENGGSIGDPRCFYLASLAITSSYTCQRLYMKDSSQWRFDQSFSPCPLTAPTIYDDCAYSCLETTVSSWHFLHCLLCADALHQPERIGVAGEYRPLLLCART